MMKIKVREWFLFILAAFFCLGLWFKFGYRQLSFVNLSVNKTDAIARAKASLGMLGVDAREYSQAVIFDSDDWADRYLQKTIGFKAEEEFIREYGYELFFWKIRFFKQSEKEEYIYKISPITNEVISFEHLIEDVATRETIGKETAKRNTEEFLKKTFGVNLNEFDLHEEKTKRFDRRSDYIFSWEKKRVYIPWKNNEGGAKLLVGATVSGDRIEKFYKNKLDVPEKFRRYIEKQLAFGEYLYSFYFIVFVFLVSASVFVVVKKKADVVIRFCKKWFLYLAVAIAIFNFAFIINNIQSVLIHYPTSVSLSSFLGIYLIRETIGLFLLGVTFIMSGIAGESLRNEVFKSKPHSSFLHYLRATFFSREVSVAIILGYCLFFIMIGVQSVVFYLGQKYLGVWKEWFRLTQFSSAYLPFLSALAIGINASFNEEVLFRLFGITWGKKYFKNTVLAVIFTALIWGFGHSQYPIFPVWFRGIEISILGIIYGFIFIRYGLIPLIVAHYLFDVFWGVAAYILGHTTAYLFTGSVFILSIPILFACIAYFTNKPTQEREILTMLDMIQRYNLGVLITFVSSKQAEGFDAASIRQELVKHNWDIELVDLAINEVFKK